MSTVPPISVVLPVHNGMPFLTEALASIAAQTFADFEVRVQDDGSTDGSLDVLRAFAADDPRFRVDSGPNEGVSRAANRAAARAASPLLVRMDADDVARPERLACLHAFGKANPDVGYFGSRVRYFPREALGSGMRHYERWLNGLVTHDEIMRDRFVEYPLPHPSTAVRAQVHRRLGGYRDGPFPEDYDFFLRAAAAGVRFGKHPEVLLDWRHGAHRTTENDPRYGLDRFQALKTGAIVPMLRADGRPLAIVGAGPDGKRWARALAGAGLDVRYFLEVHPGRIGNEIQGARVLGYDEIERAAGCFVLSAVGQKGRRGEIRELLASAGFEEGSSFLCVQ